MSTLQELKAAERDTTVTPRQLRAAGYIPATIYGPAQPSKAIQVRAHDFTNDFMHGTREFQLNGFIEGKARVQSVQRDPVSQTPLSIQFLCLNDEKATANARAKAKSTAAEPALAGA